MKLQSLTVDARARNTRIDFTPDRPVTILAGPNGAGKSTALNGLQLALSGTVTVDGKARKQAGDIFDHLSSGAPVAMFATFDCGIVARSFIRNEQGQTSQSLTFSGAPGAKLEGCQQAIAEQIGDLARVDVADLLSKGPTDRRAAVLRLCRKLAKPWTQADLKTAFDAHAQMATGYDADALAEFTFTADRELGLLGSLERDATAAADAVKGASARIKSLQQAVDRMAEQVASSAGAGDSDAMAVRLGELNAEIERLSSEASAIEGGNRSAEIIARRLNELAALPPVEKAQADLDAARAALKKAEGELAALAAPVAPVEPAEIADLRRQVAQQQRVVDQSLLVHEAAGRRIIGLEHVLGHVGTGPETNLGGECPTCARPMDATAADALRRAIEAEKLEQVAATARGDEAAEVCNFLKSDLADVSLKFHAAVEAYVEASKAHAGNTSRLDYAVTNAGRIEALAGVTLHQAQSAVAERAELRAQSAKIQTGDAEMLRTQIVGAMQERLELHRRRDAVLANDAMQTSYRTHIADRDEQTAKLAGLKVAAEAWRELVNEVAESAVRPFLDACNAALPGGWSMDFDLDSGDFRVTRGDLSVLFSALSGGERVMATAAMAVALANTAGNPWRAIILDDCDRIMGDQWAAPEYPAGLFAAFVERLAEACKAGLVDQVLMATSRRLDGAELRAVESAGARVVLMGTPRGPAPVEASDPAPEGDAPPTDTTEAQEAVRERLSRGVSVEAAEYLMRQFTDRTERPHSGPTLKRFVLDGALAQLAKGRSAASVIRMVDLAANAHPAKPRGKAAGAEATAPTAPEQFEMGEV